jgi:hypothetical protein
MAVIAGQLHAGKNLRGNPDTEGQLWQPGAAMRFLGEVCRVISDPCLFHCCARH